MYIEQLTLYTSQLEKQLDFYVTTLGFDLIEQSVDAFVVQVGDSDLRFEATEEPGYYHFAFNIPSFQSQDALEWLKTRVPILKDGETEIIEFAHWNAEAIYFYDPAGNIVELIARKNMKIERETPFTVDTILNISEIGFPVANIRATFEELQATTGIEQHSGNLEHFCATGDEFGLFIIVNKDSKKWFPTEWPAIASPFILHFSEKEKDYELHFGATGFKIN